MAADPHKPPRDDDSWGKLASDLFGINLSADDLDLSDLEPPPPPAAPAPPALPQQPLVAASSPADIDLADMDFEADDADFEDDDEEEEDVVSARPQTVASADADDEDEDDDDDEDEDDDDSEDEEDDDETADAPAAEADDFWDALESWDWEASESTPGPAYSGEAGRDRPRSDRGPRRGDRGGSRGGGRRDDRGDRPPRRDHDRPPREQRPAAATSGESAPPRERRPEPRAERPPRRDDEPRRQPPREIRPADVTDEFGEGLVESKGLASGGGWEDELPVARSERPRSEAPGRTERADEPLDDVREPIDGEEASRVPADESERPRRRRRRRRRPSGDREAPAARTDERDDFAPAETDDEPAEDVLEEHEPPRETADSEDRGERRPRRRRGRGRGRGSERPAPAEETQASASFEPADSEEPFEEEEPVVAATYENIPTWEEAISYLLKPAGDGRRDGGGYRDRGGPRRR